MGFPQGPKRFKPAAGNQELNRPTMRDQKTSVRFSWDFPAADWRILFGQIHGTIADAVKKRNAIAGTGKIVMFQIYK